MDEITVRIVNSSELKLPSYLTPQSAGMDVHACVDEPITIPPMGRVLVPTGLKLEMPKGYECQIRPRSGLALKHGITVLNTPGTVDADARAEVGVVLINLSDEPFVVHRGDRICQMVFKKCVYVHWKEVHSLDRTSREEDSWGGSGVSNADLIADGFNER